MEIRLDLNKTVEQNASEYFEKAKKARKKIKGAEEAIKRLKIKLAEEEKKFAQRLKEIEKRKKEAEERKEKRGKKAWYENFRWFVSSEGFLVIGGRDATTNEIIIKKYTDKNDLVFHTDMAGSPFFVVKTEGKLPGEATISETADATCTFSRAWKLGMSATNVFWVRPNQVSKKTESGEYMGKGAFMIRGKANYVPAKINLAIGITEEGKIMSGPLSAVKKSCKKFVELIQGNEKASDIAKKIKSKIGGEIDDIIRAMPAGGAKIK
ncbi:MAG: NFACT RNA binding domain-containing protein [Candidatus Woesearchaeota archaeon]|nr:NFACT RNA binding domain-containing protein [Candidatus Woesearchaeota archaeon]